MSKLDDILTDTGATLFCKGQDWSKANPNASEVDEVCDKANQQIKDLMLELCDTHEVLFASKEMAEEFKEAVRAL